MLSWTDWNDPLVGLSRDGKVLFSTTQTPPPAEGQQPSWAVLRATDGAPAQVLGDGIALDLSADGRWALVLQCPKGCTRLVGLPTGLGQPREIPMHGLETDIRSARWSGDGRSVYAIARAAGAGPALLHRFEVVGGRPTKISDTHLSRIGFLQLSPDGRWAAALDEQLKVVIISLETGAARSLPHSSNDAVPRGWSPRGGCGSPRWARSRAAGPRCSASSPAAVRSWRNGGSARPTPVERDLPRTWCSRPTRKPWCSSTRGV